MAPVISKPTANKPIHTCVERREKLKVKVNYIHYTYSPATAIYHTSETVILVKPASKTHDENEGVVWVSYSVDTLVRWTYHGYT